MFVGFDTYLEVVPDGKLEVMVFLRELDRSLPDANQLFQVARGKLTCEIVQGLGVFL